MYSTLLCQSFNPVFCSRTATVKVSLFLVFFKKQNRTKKTQHNPKPVFHALQYHECE